MDRPAVEKVSVVQGELINGLVLQQRSGDELRKKTDRSGLNNTKRTIMDTNIGKTDQLIRVALLVIAALFFFTHQHTGFQSTIAGIVVIYCFMTALTRYSPVWELFGINTEKKIIKKIM